MAVSVEPVRVYRPSVQPEGRRPPVGLWVGVREAHRRSAVVGILAAVRSARHHPQAVRLGMEQAVAAARNPGVEAVRRA